MKLKNFILLIERFMEGTYVGMQYGSPVILLLLVLTEIDHTFISLYMTFAFACWFYHVSYSRWVK